MGTDHRHLPHLFLPQGLHHSHDRAGRGDFVVNEDHPLAPHVTDDALHPHRQVVYALLVGRSYRHAAQSTGEVGRLLGMTDVGGHDHHVSEIATFEVLRQDAGSGEVIGGHTEEAVDLGGVKGHGHNVAGPSSHEQVSHQAGGDTDVRLILLV